MYLCELDVPGRECPNLLEDGIHCNNNTVCSFCRDEGVTEEKPTSKYVRKERWFEKYYKQ